jgi:hypothetical protein
MQKIIEGKQFCGETKEELSWFGGKQKLDDYKSGY